MMKLRGRREPHNGVYVELLVGSMFVLGLYTHVLFVIYIYHFTNVGRRGG